MPSRVAAIPSRNSPSTQGSTKTWLPWTTSASTARADRISPGPPLVKAAVVASALSAKKPSIQPLTGSSGAVPDAGNSAPTPDAIEALLRVADASAAATLAGWCDALLDPSLDDPADLAF